MDSFSVAVYLVTVVLGGWGLWVSTRPVCNRTEFEDTKNELENPLELDLVKVQEECAAMRVDLIEINAKLDLLVAQANRQSE